MKKERDRDRGIVPDLAFRARLIAGLLGTKRYTLTAGVHDIIPSDLSDRLDEKSETRKLSSYQLLLNILEEARGTTYTAGHIEIILNTLKKFILPVERMNGTYMYPNIRLTAYILRNAPEIKKRMQNMSNPDAQLSSYLESLCQFVLSVSPKRS